MDIVRNIMKKRNNYAPQGFENGFSFSIPRLPLNAAIWRKVSLKGLAGMTGNDPKNTAKATKAELQELRRAAIEAHQNDLKIIQALIEQAPEKRLTQSENGQKTMRNNTRRPSKK